VHLLINRYTAVAAETATAVQKHEQEGRIDLDPAFLCAVFCVLHKTLNGE